MSEVEAIAPRFARYVAIGDSSTEGLDDPDGRGGYRGWPDRLAERIATHQGSLWYANLAVRGLKTREIRDRQLDRAVAMRPELATLFSGTNDVVGRGFEPEEVGAVVESMHRALIGVGATVVTFTLPDLTPVMPVARLVARRVEALNETIRRAASRSGAILVDVARHPVASDPRLWSDDRLHANALGHERIATALAHAIGLPDADESWHAPLPPAPPRGTLARLAAEGRWIRRYLVPWIWRSLAGRSSADGIEPKRPELGLVNG